MTDRPTIATLGELRAAGYRPRSVKQEMRANLVERLRRGESLLPGIVGYDQTVIPQVENAILAGQDIILLGERGQAKSRIARSLVGLLDECRPGRRGRRAQRRPAAPGQPRRPRARGRAGRRARRSPGSPRDRRTARSWPPRTSPSPT